MQQYFNAQMRLLTQAGKQFAEHYPEHAGMLNIDAVKDRDPHIERLLEGFAYLTAYTQKRLDESLPEVSEQVLRQLCPILLSYYPATTVLQFQPKYMMQSTVVIKQGTKVSSHSSEKTIPACHFTTTVDSSLVPLKIVQVDYKESHQGAKLTLKFEWCCQGEKQKYNLENMRLYLLGDTPLCSSLFQLLTSGNKAIQVDFSPAYAFFNRELKQHGCHVEFASPDWAVLPNAQLSHPGYALLLDYFNAKDRSYFLTLSGLEHIEFPDESNYFELTFQSDVKLPPGHQVSAENIRLNCVQAVNLFHLDAEPIRLETNRTEYMVIPQRQSSDKIYSFNIDKVMSRNSKTGALDEYVSRYKSVYQEETHLYSLSQKAVTGPIPSFFIQVPFASNDNSGTLSVEVTAFNGEWPRKLLQEGDIKLGDNDMPSVVEVSNITRPSQYFPSPEQPKHWQLISLLNVKFSQLTDVDELKKILALFDWSNRSENRNRIEGLQKVHTLPINVIKRGIFVKGIEVELHIDESKFVCLADIYHFCAMLHQFFILYAPLNECIQTKALCLPSYTQWQWDIEPGRSYKI